MVGVILSSQSDRTKRFDVFYNLVYAKHEGSLKKLLTSASKEELVQAAYSVPVDKEAAKVRRGSHRIAKFDGWGIDELGFYLILLQEKDAFRRRETQVQSEAEKLTATLRRSSSLLRSALQKTNT